MISLFSVFTPLSTFSWFCIRLAAGYCLFSICLLYLLILMIAIDIFKFIHTQFFFANMNSCMIPTIELNLLINLMIIVSVPPHQLLLYDNSGRDVTGIVGPLEEGTDLVLTCEVRGGKKIG